MTGRKHRKRSLIIRVPSTLLSLFVAYQLYLIGQVVWYYQADITLSAYIEGEKNALVKCVLKLSRISA